MKQRYFLIYCDGTDEILSTGLHNGATAKELAAQIKVDQFDDLDVEYKTEFPFTTDDYIAIEITSSYDQPRKHYETVSAGYGDFCDDTKPELPYRTWQAILDIMEANSISVSDINWNQ